MESFFLTIGHFQISCGGVLYSKNLSAYEGNIIEDCFVTQLLVNDREIEDMAIQHHAYNCSIYEVGNVTIQL